MTSTRLRPGFKRMRAIQLVVPTASFVTRPTFTLTAVIVLSLSAAVPRRRKLGRVVLRTPVLPEMVTVGGRLTNSILHAVTMLSALSLTSTSPSAPVATP